MALAGAERIFEMVDTEPEDKGGDITLTYGEHEEGKWAWKKPVENGFEYIPLKGDIRFNDVTFGYTEKYQFVCETRTKNRVCRFYGCR